MTVRTTDKVRVHRFHDMAAFHGANGTEYLTAATARKFAALLLECAADIEAHEFTDSPFSGADTDSRTGAALQFELGMFNVCADVAPHTGDLQLRVYPRTDGELWDDPVAVFGVAATDCRVAE